jgi:hypothetical protein
MISDLTGSTFGRLTVLSMLRLNKHRRTVWLCRCIEGNLVEVDSGSLKSGNTTSCGCYRKELVGTSRRKHGKSSTPLYFVWAQMRYRCLNESNSDYPDYGGRGIRYCNDWDLFEKFDEWAIDSGYKDGLILDRIDVNGNYEPNNCRWVTDLDSSRNKRNNIVIQAFGESKKIHEWLKDSKCKVPTHKILYERIKNGWESEKAISTPKIGNR